MIRKCNTEILKWNRKILNRKLFNLYFHILKVTCFHWLIQNKLISPCTIHNTLYNNSFQLARFASWKLLLIGQYISPNKSCLGVSVLCFRLWFTVIVTRDRRLDVSSLCLLCSPLGLNGSSYAQCNCNYVQPHKYTSLVTTCAGIAILVAIY